MRYLMAVVALLALVLAMDGCTVASGEFGKSNATEVVLREKNFSHVQSVQGEDGGFKVFGLGSTAQYAAAMNDLRVAAGLKGTSRALVNVTEASRTTFWFGPLVMSQRLLLTADVVEFKAESSVGQAVSKK